MKRFLFCAGILALAASCTQDEFETASVNGAQDKGITFEVGIAETPQTKGEYQEESGQHNFFWYAEQDRINIWSTWTAAFGTGNGNGANGSAAWDATKYATYKATQSAATGKFTGIDDNNTLDFYWDADDITAQNQKDRTSKFFATYPVGVTVSNISADGKFTLTGLPVLDDQDQGEAQGNAVTEKLMMYSSTEAYPQNSYDAVGEKINLNLQTPFNALILRTENLKGYEKYFGKLKSIEVEALGYDANGNGTVDQGDIAGSYIDYGSAVNYLYDSTDDSKSKLVKASDGSDITDWSTMTDASQSITLQINGGAGLDWSDDMRAYMAVNTVKRDAFRNATPARKESIRQTYTFEHIILSPEDYLTNNDWRGCKDNGNSFLRLNSLDINKFDYLVTEVSTSNDRTLIVNGGATEGFTFSDIFEANTNNLTVNWPAGDAATSEFSTIIVNNITLTDEEMALLKNFTNLKEIKLGENTSIPTNTFNQVSLKIINFPKVKSEEGKDGIASGAFASAVNLEEVYLPSYGFENEVIAEQFMKKGSLKILDMSGVPSMNIGFPSTGFTLSGFTVLETVTVQDGVQLGSNSFNGCEALKKVNGSVYLQGSGVFSGCEALPEIYLTGTVIPAAAFQGCELLVNVRDAATKKQIMPTEVQANAFNGCKELLNMDLRNIDPTSTIGESAFESCSKLYGIQIDNNTKKILYVGGQVIAADAFKGCAALEHIEFLDATSVNGEFLNVAANTTVSRPTTPALIQVQFDKTFTGTNLNASSFGGNNVTAGTNGVDLFITSGQSGFNGSNVLTLGSNKYTFKSAQIRGAGLDD